MFGNRFNKVTKINSGILLGIFLFLTTACNPSPEIVAITSTPEIIVTRVTGKLIIIADVVNLRTGPGVTFELHGTLSKDETVVFDGILSTGNWYRLTDGSWVAENFVELVNDEMSETTTPTTVSASPPSLPTETETSTSTSTVTLTSIPTKIPPTLTVDLTITFTESSIMCQTASNVFLMSGPGNKNVYHIVKALSKGIEMVVLGGNRQNGDHTHYKVRDDDGNQGWLYIDLCPVSSDPTIGFEYFPPPFTPTSTPTPIPSYTPTPSQTPTATPTLFQAVSPTVTPTLILALSPTPGATNSPPPPTWTPILPETVIPTATGTPPSQNVFR